MSAYWAVCFDDRIEIVSDGAMHNHSGVLTGIHRKVASSHLLPVAVRVARGV